MTRLRITTVLAPAAILAATLSCGVARAQSADDKAAAEALFDDGKRLFLAKKYAEACPKLESSQRLDPGIGTLLFLADCYEGLGKIASAWATFRDAAAQAKAAGQGDRERVARARAAALEPKLYRLTIAVAAPDTPRLEVLRNGAAVRREIWGSGVPVDPGAYTLSAAAPGKRGFTLEVRIPDGPGAQTVTIPALEDAPAQPSAAPPPPPPPKAAEPPPAPPPPPPPPEGLGGQRIAGIVLGSAGVVALGLGAGFGGAAMASNGTAKSLCPAVQCSNGDGVDASHRAGTFADVATGMFVAGGVLAATGLVVILTAPSKKAPQSAWIAPAAGAGFTGLTAGRTW